MNILFLICFISIFPTKNDYAGVKKLYKKADIIFYGKLSGIRKMDMKKESDSDLFKSKYMLEYEISSIFKGKKYTRIILVDTVESDHEGFYKVNKKYLVYVIKKKIKIKEGKKKIYMPVHIRNYNDLSAQNEIRLLRKHIKKSIFRREKDPNSGFRIIFGGCNCL